MDLRVYVDALKSWVSGKGSKRGELYIVDFFTRAVLEQRGFQVRIGTITAPVTGDIDITDAAAEACADAQTGMTIIPTSVNVDVESFAGGTLPTAAAKSVGAISTAGAVFVSLPLFIGGASAVTTARVAVAGGVTVTAELATTTRVHLTNTIAAVGNQVPLVDKEFRVPPVLKGPACFYLQVAAVTAGPVYFAHFDYLEFATADI